MKTGPFCNTALLIFSKSLVKMPEELTNVLFLHGEICENTGGSGEYFMSEAEALIKKLDTEKQTYLQQYFANAPRWLMDSFQVVRIPKGTAVVTESEKADMVYILMRGRVVAVDYRVQERAYGFITFHPIEVFGAMEILVDMDRYKTTLETTKDSIFLKISREIFEKWIKNDMNAFQMQTKKVGRYLIEEARKERLYVLLEGVGRIYLMLYEWYQVYGTDGTCSIYISRKNFAEMTGLSERTITRTLKDLEEKGYITREGWNILITQEQFLWIKELIEDKISEIGV